MRRLILERQHVAARNLHYRLRIKCTGQLNKRPEHGREFFGSFVIGNDDQQGPSRRLLQQCQEQSFRSRGQPRQTYPPRALAQMGGSTPKGGQSFHVREDLADERQKHALSFYQAKRKDSPEPPKLYQHSRLEGMSITSRYR